MTATASTGDRARLAAEVIDVHGVVNVRELLTHQQNLVIELVDIPVPLSEVIGPDALDSLFSLLRGLARTGPSRSRTSAIGSSFPATARCR
nr:hypothetical protein [Halorientalis brevis]